MALALLLHGIDPAHQAQGETDITFHNMGQLIHIDMRTVGEHTHLINVVADARQLCTPEGGQPFGEGLVHDSSVRERGSGSTLG